MEGEVIGALSAAIIGLFGVIAVLVRRDNKNHRDNPNFATMDEKLNQILLVLTEIKAAVQNCPAVRR